MVFQCCVPPRRSERRERGGGGVPLSLSLPASAIPQDCTNTQFQFTHERLQSPLPPLSPQQLVSASVLIFSLGLLVFGGSGVFSENISSHSNGTCC